jgi:hypothetical protein
VQSVVGSTSPGTQYQKAKEDPVDLLLIEWKMLIL